MESNPEIEQQIKNYELLYGSLSEKYPFDYPLNFKLKGNTIFNHGLI
jgi:hypothetical protein